MKYSLHFSLIILAILLSISMEAHSAEYRYPANDKLLLYAPGYSTPDDKQDAIADKGLDLFEKAAHFNASLAPPFKDEAASVELVKQFGEYGTIIMHTHVWWWPFEWTYFPEHTFHLPGFRTGTVVSFSEDGEPNDPSYLNDLGFIRQTRT